MKPQLKSIGRYPSQVQISNQGMSGFSSQKAILGLPNLGTIISEHSRSRDSSQRLSPICQQDQPRSQIVHHLAQNIIQKKKLHIAERHSRYVLQTNKIQAPKMLAPIVRTSSLDSFPQNSPSKSKSPKLDSISQKLEKSTYRENQRELLRNLEK